MWGFGEPDGFNTGTPHFGWGFGDPEPDSWVPADSQDWGFGDPPSFDDLIVFFTSGALYPDDGGDLVQLSAAWPEIEPYRVRLIDTHTGEVFPNPDVQYACNSDTPGQGYICKTNTKVLVVGDKLTTLPGKYLRFTLPPLPPSVYDVEIVLNEGQATITIDSALTITLRNRSRKVWGIRTNLPQQFDVGSRTSSLEDLVGEEDFSTTNWGP